MSRTCRKCGAKCCTYFCFQIDEPQTYAQFEDVRWFVCHEGISVHIDEGKWYIAIANRCRMLQDDHRCRIYDERPLICRKYSLANCDHTEGDYEFQAVFETPQDVENYARRKLGEAGYDRAKAAARAQAGQRPKKSKRKPK